MQSQKFLKNYKCECYEQNYCNCPHKSVANAVFLDNIYDIADALAQVMIICGIHQCKAKATFDVIIYSFLHYDEIRHRIDTVPRKRLCKEDLVHDLGRKCLMNRMEAQLTYSIIKRAFKAFYHGTTEGGIRNPVLEAQLVHSQECQWVHAAKRTAQIFASYEGMFYLAQKNYEAQIKCVYKHLYDRMQARASPVELEECSCKGCMKRAVVDLPKPTRSHYSLHETPIANSNILNDETDSSTSDNAALPVLKMEGLPDTANGKLKKLSDPSNTSLHLPRCYECNCPKLICDCDVDRKTGVLTAECSQGPFKCQWVRMDDDEKQPDPCIEIPEDHQCPIDCDDESVICDVECECDCDVCECPAEDSSDYEDNDSADVEKEEEELIEPTPSIQCDLPDISELESIGFMPVAHVVEEEREKPTTLAKVEGHKKEPSFISETLEEKQRDSEEMMKIIDNII